MKSNIFRPTCTRSMPLPSLPPPPLLCAQSAEVHTSRMVLGRMQLTLHATRRAYHRVSRLMNAISAWSVKTHHIPSRHRRDVRVYGHTTTATHETSTPPLPLQFITVLSLSHSPDHTLPGRATFTPPPSPSSGLIRSPIIP